MLWATDPNREKDQSPDEQEAGGVVFPSLTVKSHEKVTDKVHPGVRSQPAYEGANTADTDSSHEADTDCFECLDFVQNCLSPQTLHILPSQICSTERIFMDENEILVLP